MAELPEYTFLPWSRRGIAVRIDQPDHLGANPAEGPKDRATMTASVAVSSMPVPGAPPLAPVTVTQEVSLVGPGDIKGFTPDAVLRSMPVPGSVNATPGELAYVEFYDEEFPWRYTPAHATTAHKLRPWIALFVLADGEYTLTRVPGELAILTVAVTAPLPPVTETWAWAHVQTQGDLGLGDPGDLLNAHVDAAPNLALSRLLSPRRLDLHTGYHAFVVPAMETGRLAGLREPFPSVGVPAQQPSWGQGQPRRFPVLHDWSFRTGELADFEVLARRPKAFRIEAEGFGTRELDISDPGAGLEVDEGTTVAFEGALAPVDFDSRVEYPSSPGTDVADQVEEVIDLAVDFRVTGIEDDEDPIVTPPAYARKHAGLRKVADATGATRWVAELNLDPRNRAAAGLGAEIVRQRDEEYMERAWAQVEELNAVNQRLREAELALTADERVFAKHVAHSSVDRLLGLTAGAQAALRARATGDITIRGEVDASRVPAAAQAPAFRRITRPASPLLRPATPLKKSLVLDQTGLTAHLITRLNDEPGSAVSTAPPAPDPALAVDQSDVQSAVDAVAAQLPRGRDVFPVLVGEEVEARRGAGTLSSATTATALEALGAALGARLDEVYPESEAANHALRAEVEDLLAHDVDGVAVSRLKSLIVGTGDDPTVLEIDAPTFAEYYGTTIDGKSHLGTVIAPEGSERATVAPSAGLHMAADFAVAMSSFTTFASSRLLPEPPIALTAPAGLADQVLAQLRPRVALLAKVATVIGGVGDLRAGFDETRRLSPAMAHPEFDDPLFEPLRQLGQDYIIPNIANLPEESIALMVPNARFIESMLAGVSTEFARELLWNEFPTDQRGTYFARFFDAADAGTDRPPDIPKIHEWEHDLGANSPQLSGLLVLVVRAELLVKFPDTVVFAQEGEYSGTGSSRKRTLRKDGVVKYPVIHGKLDPDISLFGFELTAEDAAGEGPDDAGYFFCFMERPGQLRFGLDLDEDPTTEQPELPDWNALNWKHLHADAAALPAQVLVTENAGLTPTTPDLTPWGLTSAHMASILCQNPVWLARHATDMLPID
ncbi:hypothetical protein ABZ477_17675 [Microbacterium sp. NPDC019599]|uniref:hypothetical protein n=1 Tax=Microbacterium sp. NPDC019599 TaxID=3154690 RepID=UPI0033D4D115